jgi:hypothetical protein
MIRIIEMFRKVTADKPHGAGVSASHGNPAFLGSSLLTDFLSD